MAACNENLLTLKIPQIMVEHFAKFGVGVLLSSAHVHKIDLGSAIGELLGKGSHVLVTVDDVGKAERLGQIVKVGVRTHKDGYLLGVEIMVIGLEVVPDSLFQCLCSSRAAI